MQPSRLTRSMSPSTPPRLVPSRSSSSTRRTRSRLVRKSSSSRLVVPLPPAAPKRPSRNPRRPLHLPRKPHRSPMAPRRRRRRRRRRSPNQSKSPSPSPSRSPSLRLPSKRRSPSPRRTRRSPLPSLATVRSAAYVTATLSTRTDLCARLKLTLFTGQDEPYASPHCRAPEAVSEHGCFPHHLQRGRHVRPYGHAQAVQG